MAIFPSGRMIGLLFLCLRGRPEIAQPITTVELRVELGRLGRLDDWGHSRVAGGW